MRGDARPQTEDCVMKERRNVVVIIIEERTFVISCKHYTVCRLMIGDCVDIISITVIS